MTEEVKPMQFTVAQVVPWVLVLLLAVAFGAYVIGKNGGGVPAPVPSPVGPVVPVPAPLSETTVEKLDKILTAEEGLTLSAVCRNISVLISKDEKSVLFDETKDIHTLIKSTGTVVTLERGSQYVGLGAILATYFDEDTEFPQKVGALTPEARAQAVAAWLKMSEDLAKVK